MHEGLLTSLTAEVVGAVTVTVIDVVFAVIEVAETNQWGNLSGDSYLADFRQALCLHCN